MVNNVVFYDRLTSPTLRDRSWRSSGSAFQVVGPQHRRPDDRMCFVGSAAQSSDIDWRSVNR